MSGIRFTSAERQQVRTARRNALMVQHLMSAATALPSNSSDTADALDAKLAAAFRQ